ncbi:hypothetical protein [Actinophytocola sp. NPDC049390]|uniref:hypothetical protein n=1 Tax=Actinophytocola sp. NPDC049390 TaxID=3363894 RepID=UPI003795F46E
MRSAVALCGLVLLLVAGCATQGGVEVAGRASQVSPPPSQPTLPSGTPASADPVAVLRADPQVTPKVKAGLVPCEGGQYPTDDRYVDLTGDGKGELVVLLFDCRSDRYAKAAAEGVGLVPYPGYAAYVYNLVTEPPTRLLGVEGQSIDVLPGKGKDLVLIRGTWSAEDDPCCPFEQTVVLYRWNGSRLVEVPR